MLKILVVGVGGAGSNIIDDLSKETYKNIVFYKINTDKQALVGNRKIKTYQLGSGLGAGMKPDVGLKAAKEHEEDLLKITNGYDLIFIAAGMGGGTGTGAAPYIAELAKKSGALTIGVITEPFNFEGKKRTLLALEGTKEFELNCHSSIIIKNNSLLSLIDKRCGIKDSFKLIDNIFSTVVNGIVGVLLSKGSNDINLDFADLKTIFEENSSCAVGFGNSNVSAEEAIKKSLEHPLLKNNSFENTIGVMIHFEVNPNFSFIDLSMAMEEINNVVKNESANIIFGTTTNEKMAENEVSVTFISSFLKNRIDDNVGRTVHKIKY